MEINIVCVCVCVCAHARVCVWGGWVGAQVLLNMWRDRDYLEERLIDEYNIKMDL